MAPHVPDPPDDFACDARSLMDLVNHIVLPSKLPQSGDADPSPAEQGMLRLARGVSGRYIQTLDANARTAWTSIVTMLDDWAGMKQGADLRNDILAAKLSSLKNDGCIALHLAAQNAGLLIHKRDHQTVTFECFEASPTSESVMTTQGRLLRAFPGRAVSCPAALLSTRHFCTELARSLRQLNNEPVGLCSASTTKAGSEVAEDRDTTNPMMVVDYLMNILCALGQNENPILTHKYTRDDVLWHKARVPFRRSPFWLVLRVAIQRTLAKALTSHEAQLQYKTFMVVLIAQVLERSLTLAASSDVIATVHAKLARRVHKLEQQFGEKKLSDIMKISCDARKALETMWHKAQAAARRDLSTVPFYDEEMITCLTLANARPHLTDAVAELPANIESTLFMPKSQMRTLQDPKQLPSLRSLGASESEVLLLADIELWVEDHLEAWLQDVQPGSSSAKACDDLVNLIEQYWNLAMSEYKVSPLEKSEALLIILELWVALDKICVAALPLLAEYSPEIPSNLLEPLLLPKMSQMKRLLAIETYLTNRGTVASLGLPNILTGDITPSSFSSRHYDRSTEMRELRTKIDEYDAGKREQKLKELERLAAEYTELVHDADLLTCSTIYNRRGRRVHDRNCRKCRLEEKAKQMKITVDEKSLPESIAQLKAAVFELAVPTEFAAWRDATWMILQDVSRKKVKNGVPSYSTPSTYSQLARFEQGGARQRRITIASNTKSFLVAHYKQTGFPVYKSVCVHNGLHYRLWDRVQSKWLDDSTPPSDVKVHCITPLPDGPYQNLEWTYRSFKHTDNAVIAKQDECHKELDLQEYIAFGSLRAGEHLQWLNIMKELGRSCLNQNTSAVNMLLYQASSEAGRYSGNALRQAHIVFEDSAFCHKLLHMLKRFMTAIESNWNEQFSMSTIIRLVSRLLSLAKAPNIITECITHIRKARTVTLGWCRYLKTHLHTTSDNEETQLRGNNLLLSAALLCFSTYDVERDHLSKVLQSAVDLAVAAEVQTLIHDHLPGDRGVLTPDMQRNLVRRCKVAQAIEPHLRALVAHDGSGLNQAIQALWHGAKLESRWGVGPGKDSQWVVNYTIVSVDGRVQTVHYNLLSGALVVDGRPLGKVPDFYKKQALYQKIFGPAVLDVFASDMPGMLYRVSRALHDNEVHLGLKNGKVVIRARVGETVFRALSPDIFCKDLPSYFIENFAHWLNESTGEIELRPLEWLWASRKDNWRLTFSSLDFSTAKARLRLDDKTLVDPRSETGQAIANILSPLDSTSYIHITVTGTSPGKLEVGLHRYNLHFSLTTDGQLKSIEYDAIVDSRQDVGTFIGLQNKLVLREVDSASDTYERSVLVPFGDPSLGKSQHHVQVSILSDRSVKQRYFVYKLDQQLHKLRGPGDNLSSLYKAYLHAVTSYTLPDPFTLRTGTSEALATLKEASIFSCAPLTAEAWKVLNSIASLTPKRQFYPKHLRQMQDVSWNNELSSLIQDDELLPAAQAVLDYSNKFSGFYADSSVKKSLDTRGDKPLLDRARERNVYSSGHVVTVTSQDRSYSSRDQFTRNDRSKRVHIVASLVKDWPAELSTQGNLASTVKSWNKVSGYHESFSTSALSELLKLKIPTKWGALYELYRTADRDKMTYRLMFLSCAIVFDSSEETVSHIKRLLAFSFSSSFRSADPPARHTSYTLNNGSSPEHAKIRDAIENCTNATWDEESVPPDDLPEDEWSDHVSNKGIELHAELDSLQAHVIAEWPARTIAIHATQYRYITKSNAVMQCQNLFNEWHKNRDFLAHIATVQSRADAMKSIMRDSELPPLADRQAPGSHSLYRMTTISELLKDKTRLEQVIFAPIPKPLALRRVFSHPQMQDYTEIEGLVHTFQSSTNERRSKYGEVFSASLEALKRQPKVSDQLESSFSKQGIRDYYELVHRLAEDTLESIGGALSPRTTAQAVLNDASLWPRVSNQSLLSLLCPASIGSLQHEWKSILLSFGEVIAQLQRAGRLLKMSRTSDTRAIVKELENPGRQGWSVTEYPGWLLLEIENNITIRPQQAKVALEMMNPSSGASSALQLHCGEGKSSVIIPMIVVALADTERLVRVIVLKPLLRQTEQLLSQRIGGLLGQRVYHVPFSRKTPLNTAVIQHILGIFRECELNRGVMLALPEHILSFRLMGREKMSSDSGLAATMLNVERWLQRNSRDVLDESDEILDTRFQLVYTTGSQTALDGQPDRWLITQAILARVNFHVKDLVVLYPDQLEIDRKGTSFPFLRFLKNDVGDHLVALLVGDIMEGQLMGISFDYYTERARKAIKSFINDRIVADADLDIVNQACAASQNYKVLLVLRGLIAHGILLFALQQKRWHVEYGLDPSRCLMAVPYRAKGVPSLSSEYGHPDVAILLTSLSYYYTGLSFVQIRQCFVILSKDSNSEDVYARWVSSCENLPANLMSLEALNLEDEALCTEKLFPELQRNVEVANFYLSKVVFPKEGKEFAKKISCSGWDIPSTSKSTKLLTTGFSGTNDNRFLLPYSISQGDMPDLHHTNAMVLDLILRPENKTYVHASTDDSRKLSVPGLLELISSQSPRIDVLIDVGAQVLEMTNREVAVEWLNQVDDAKAAIYFDDNDEAVVLDRNGASCPLRISAFRSRLEGCLIYLDEVHTRGIDLQISSGARAAVTLGPRLVKDRLVQACMRMRKLGVSHALCFFSPPEVHQNIVDGRADKTTPITSKDVLCWCMEQTCLAMDTAQPLRIMQGLEYMRRQKILDSCLSSHLIPSDIIKDKQLVERFWHGIQENESQTLDQMYGVHDGRISTFARLLDRKSRSGMMKHLVDEFDTMEILTLEDSSMDNEQEREVAHEIERERQAQRPGQVKPAVSIISDGLEAFIKTGIIPEGKTAKIHHAFKLFMQTSAQSCALGRQVHPEAFSIYATNEFMYPVVLAKGSRWDEYLRPVSWVLSSLRNNELVIISPHEANELLARIRTSSVVLLHTFAPKVNKKMVSFDDMSFYTPSSMPCDRVPTANAIRNLNLFAGSLYLNTLSNFEQLCHFLGIVTPSRRPKDKEVNGDGFARPVIRKHIGWPEECPFDQSPLEFLKQVFSLRMHGQDYGHTHMGLLVGGRAVRESSFQ